MALKLRVSQTKKNNIFVHNCWFLKKNIETLFEIE